jgi:hypothetical protein
MADPAQFCPITADIYEMQSTLQGKVMMNTVGLAAARNDARGS